MSSELGRCYEHCRRIARAKARNFYYAFLALPPRERMAMCALYAYLRETDDLGDNPSPAEERRSALARWRADLTAALDGQPSSPVLTALADTAANYRIPPEYLTATIDGVLMDVDGRTYATFAELTDYCYHVASVVGLSCIHIWGFTSEEAKPHAVALGYAFQLTNILRDIREDHEQGRIYLPSEDLARFGYSPADLAARVYDDRFRALMRFEIARARAFYDDGAKLRPYLSPMGRRSLDVMVGIYRGLLEEIDRRGGNIFEGRIRLSRWQKWRIALGSFWPWSGGVAMSAGVSL